MNAIELLKQDHERVRKLFREYGEAGERLSEKRYVAEQVLAELAGHSAIEEEVFYPAVRAKAADLQEQIELDQHEHQQIDRLVEELKGLNPASDLFEERFQALIGAVEYHIAAEEAEILPRAARALGDQLEQLGRQMVARRKELVQQVTRT